MNRQSIKKRRVSLSRPEGLESRGLLTAGIAIGTSVIMNLGEVSTALATHGVEVSAPIASHSSITFAFEMEAAGNYLLKVRHDGEGLTLTAKGPSGSASVDPGPAGPFETIDLPLKAAEYEITATATGDQPVFVDWELLLSSGVAQSAATGTTLVVTSVALPPSPSPTSVAPTVSPSSSVSPSTVSANWGSVVSPSMVAVSGPVGRTVASRAITPVGPTSPNGDLALAFAGDAIPVGALVPPSSVATEDQSSTGSSVTSLLTLELMGNGEQDLAALGAPTWLDRLAEMESLATSETSDQVDPEVGVRSSGERLDAGAEEKTSNTTTASFGLITSGLMISLATVRMWPNLGLSGKHPKSSNGMRHFPRSMGRILGGRTSR